MRRFLATGLLALVAGLLVPALAFAYSNRAAESAPSAAIAMAEDGDPEADATAKGWVGLYLANLNKKLADRLGLDRQEGVVVLRVVKDGPADQAGVEQSDIILRVDGEDVADVKETASIVLAATLGDTLTLGVLRGMDEQDIAVTVGERPQPKRAKHGQTPRVLRLLAPMAGKLMSAEITLADADGNPVTLAYVAGTVTEVEGANVTIEPKDGGDDLALTITDDTAILKRGKPGDEAALAVGDEVIAVWKDGDLVAVVAVPSHDGGAAPKRGSHRFHGALGGLAQAGGHGGTRGPGSGFMLRQLPGTLGDDLRGWAPGTRGGSRGPRAYGGGDLGQAPAPNHDLRQGLQRPSQELEGLLAS